MEDTSASLLVKLASDSDHTAWETFCDVYAPLICTFACRRGLQQNDAADVTQEVLIRVVRSIRTFEYDRHRGRFRDWLYRIVRNELARWRGKQARHDSESLEDPAAEVTAEWSESFQQHILETALARIRAVTQVDAWHAFEQTWLLGKPAQEVARETGCKLDFVYHAKSRTLKKLQLEIAHLTDDAV